MSHLFDAWSLRDLTFTNRIVVSPMCQYSCDNGLATDWHLVHLGTRAVGGAGLVFTEAAAVTPEGRISPHDLGLWSDAHAEVLAPVVRFIRAQGRVAGVQLAHAGRKASTKRPWDGMGGVAADEGGWEPIGPDTQAFSDSYPTPRMMTLDDIRAVPRAFADAAARARDIGVEVVEVHAAHGYLLHEFLSPLSNTRTDEYGGSFEGRVRLCLDVVDAVRAVWPERLPLFVRISSTDWTAGGWDIGSSVALAVLLKSRGVDLIDCSSGGNVARATIPLEPGYQVPFASRIRREAEIATGAVGLITTPQQADAIIANGHADCVFLARELLRSPYWPLHAAKELGQETAWPSQYLRARS
ncbi:MAG: NADH:flavin oxidoreductase/NADH oxidase [Acidobacteria bacterium]|nr:NADH:flavin oxidoreductase/NADH oxidase [Acidobacteriota bacterium]